MTGGRLAGRRSLPALPAPWPRPDAAWATVCLGASGTVAGEPRRGSSLLLVRLRWRAPGTAGTALVRLDAPHRHPAPCAHRPGPHPCDTHLWADPDTRHRPDLSEYADVLVSQVSQARVRVDALLARRPGCLVAAVPDRGTGCLVGVRDAAARVRYARTGPGGLGAPVPPYAVASLVHAWVVAGRAPELPYAVALDGSGSGP